MEDDMTGRSHGGNEGAGFEKRTFHGASILIVDDHVNLLELLSRMLSGAGFSVQTASCGYQALRVFSRADYGVVLTDFNMPGMDGLTLAHLITNRSPKTPVIMMTGADEGEIAKIEKSPSVACVLRKPFRWEDLDDAVVKALARKPDFSRLRGALSASAPGVGRSNTELSPR
jgi:DNA-binding NtrC family response regulator